MKSESEILRYGSEICIFIKNLQNFENLKIKFDFFADFQLIFDPLSRPLAPADFRIYPPLFGARCFPLVVVTSRVNARIPGDAT